MPEHFRHNIYKSASLKLEELKCGVTGKWGSIARHAWVRQMRWRQNDGTAATVGTTTPIIPSATHHWSESQNERARRPRRARSLDRIQITNCHTRRRRPRQRRSNSKISIRRQSAIQWKGKRVKASHTRYRALGPELIPVYSQSARKWLKSSTRR